MVTSKKTEMRSFGSCGGCFSAAFSAASASLFSCHIRTCWLSRRNGGKGRRLTLRARRRNQTGGPIPELSRRNQTGGPLPEFSRRSRTGSPLPEFSRRRRIVRIVRHSSNRSHAAPAPQVRGPPRTGHVTPGIGILANPPALSRFSSGDIPRDSHKACPPTSHLHNFISFNSLLLFVTRAARRPSVPLHPSMPSIHAPGRGARLPDFVGRLWRT